MKPFIQGLFDAFPALNDFVLFNKTLAQNILPNAIDRTREYEEAQRDLAESWVAGNISIKEWNSSLSALVGLSDAALRQIQLIGAEMLVTAAKATLAASVMNNLITAPSRVLAAEINLQAAIDNANRVRDIVLGQIVGPVPPIFPIPPIPGAGGAEVNPFEQFVQQAQIREIILKAGMEGQIAWQEVARLWSLGAKEAAQQFANVLLNQMGKTSQQIGEEFRNLAIKWLDGVERGILEGTVDVLDAIEFLEHGMVDAARSIVDSLEQESRNIAEQWQILVEAIEQGFVTLTEVKRLFELGAPEAALEFLRALVGRPSIVGEAIRRHPMLEWRGPPRNLDQGAFIPPGPPVPALLHGPEVVVPLGNITALTALQRALSGFTGGSGGAFRNYGHVNVYAAGDADTRLMRTMIRALGVS